MKKQFCTVFFTVFMLLISCENQIQTECSDATVKMRAYAYLKEWYLWYEHIPLIDPTSYDSLADMMNAVKYREGDKLIDRFSYVASKAEHDGYYAGKRYGMGLSWMRNDANELYISMVYPGSPAGDAGLRRGQKVLAMNGVTVEELDENGEYNKQHRNDAGFEEKTDWNNVYNAENKGEEVKFLVLDEGQELETTVVLDDYTAKSVLASKVLESGGVKTGYLHLKSFINSSEDELNEAFAIFKEENVEQLVLDLRYNGGGLVKIAEQLVNLVAGSKGKDQSIIKIIYNNKHSEKNVDYKGKVLKNSLENVKKVAFIVSSGTASASEMVLNSLTPFFDVVIVGETTYGKPVGMNALDICEETIVPITFKYANAEDYGDFFLGIDPDCQASDDFMHDFGDESEGELAAALYYFANGKCSAEAAARKTAKRRRIEELIPRELKGMGKIDYTF